VTGEPVTQWSMWIDDVKVADCVNKDEGGTWSPIATVPIAGGGKMEWFSEAAPTKTDQEIHKATPGATLTFAGVPFPSKPITAFEIHKSSIGYVLCSGCSYAKYPNKGPGYSERCDKCKLDALRPSYKSK
jgi:uncharacterized membrane protein